MEGCLQQALDDAAEDEAQALVLGSGCSGEPFWEQKALLLWRVSITTSAGQIACSCGGIRDQTGCGQYGAKGLARH